MADNAVVQGDEGEPQGAAEDEDELTDFEEEGVLTAIESLKSVNRVRKPSIH